MITDGKRENRSPFRERRWHNISMGAIISFILVFTVPIPLIISLFSMEQYVSVGVLTATWIVLASLMFFIIRKSRLNSYHIVDEKITQKTIVDLESDRVNDRQKFTATEITELRKGKKIPVLDVWRSDPQLKSRHTYFSRIVHTVIDPQKKEMEMLIQLPALQFPSPNEPNMFRKQFCQRIGDFLKIAAGEPRVIPFKDFVNTVIIECDSLREDTKGYDVPFPVFSMELTSKEFWKLSSLVQYQEISFDRIADVRFADGAKIEPHRTMRDRDDQNIQ